MRIIGTTALMSILVLLTSCTSSKMPPSPSPNAIASSQAEPNTIAAIFGKISGSNNCPTLKPEEVNSPSFAFNGTYLTEDGKIKNEVTLVVFPQKKIIFSVFGRSGHRLQVPGTCSRQTYRVETNKIVYSTNRGSSKLVCHDKKLPNDRCAFAIDTLQINNTDAPWIALLGLLPRKDG